MTTTVSPPSRATLAIGSIVLLTLSLALATAAHATEYFVNNASGSCSSAGPGTPDAPYCTIGAALTAHHEPGVVITVMPGTYREQVTLPASGLAGSPITLRAQPGAGPAVVDGTNDFSNPALWTDFSGDVWLAASVTAAPRQVFADDQRLTPSTAPPASLPARSFAFVAGSGLYVNAGGGNPGTHRTQVGTRLRGIFVSGKSFVVIRGFTVRRCEDRCIQLTNASAILVDGNTLSFSGGFGLQASGDSADRIVSNVSSNNAGHGFSLVNNTVDATIEDNVAFDNADPSIRVANGLFVGASSRNMIRRNRWHHNQDSGEQFSPGCTGNVSIQNRSWANGDHGFDHNQATGTLHVNDVAYGNFKDGFSIEGSSSGTRLFNSIAIENGVTTNEYDLWVDSLSTSGFESNDNVLWNSGPQAPVKIGHTVYASVSGYAAARGQDSRTLQADPRFADAAHGDFHLTAGSPAIDDANSGVAGWPSTDAEGNARADDPGTPNRGLGPVPFADRGALEFQGSTPTTNQPPVARLTATPSSGTAPLAVRLDASGSSDPDGTIASYRFDFGDGTSVGPQTSAVANHTYAAGTWTATVTVTDNQGATATARATVTANAPPPNQPPTAALSVSPSSGTAPLTVSASAAGSSDPDGHIVSYLFDFGDGTRVGPQTSSTAGHTYAAGHWSARVVVTDDDGATASASASVTVSSPPSNLVANGTFEASLTGWAAFGGASIRRVTGGHTGTYSLLASAPLLSLSSYGINDQPDWVQGTAGVGTRYHVRAWVRAELGVGLASLAVREWTPGGASSTTRSSSLTLGTGWAALDLDVVTRFAGSALDLSIMNAPSVLGTAFRVDDVSIVQGAGEPALVAAIAGEAVSPPPADDAFLAPGVHPNPMRADGARIVFTAAEPGPAEIAIFDLAGRVVRRIAGDRAAPAGPRAAVFDGRGDDGRRLPGGVYYYEVRSPGAAAHGRLVILE